MKKFKNMKYENQEKYWKHKKDMNIIENMKNMMILKI